jgi:Arc/MetJ-type ribon-helix-helix transcriptional regulator
MTAARKIQVEVSEEVAQYLDRQVATGGFADQVAVVRHALQEATEADAEMDRWLREDVSPVVERMDREGPSDLTADEVFDGVRERYLARKNAG